MQAEYPEPRWAGPLCQEPDCEEAILQYYPDPGRLDVPHKVMVVGGYLLPMNVLLRYGKKDFDRVFPEVLKTMKEHSFYRNRTVPVQTDDDMIMHAHHILNLEAEKEGNVHMLFMGEELETCKFIAATHFKDIDSWIDGAGMTEADVRPVSFEETDFDRQVKTKLMEALEVLDLEFGTMLYHENGLLP
ncbi:hypothetical protein EUX98_g824 [Antrodiella citrinella]|uniref:Uncharacterized protein n=1 Tax=Antrodiella citrinella TaxID=2447956 RepID=A0A4S4N2Z6_9APHY|nr:hypothetical protein EUX98_g824 [Antrodiella citrinella]